LCKGNTFPTRLLAVGKQVGTGDESETTKFEDDYIQPSGAKDIDRLAADARRAVENAPNRYAISGQGDVKRLTGRIGFRLRVGRYRVIFDEDAYTILAIYIGKRETATYRRN
jgi:mRNA interferase RelE/StbE